MANDDKVDNVEQNDKEVLDFLNSFSKDKLVKALFDEWILKALFDRPK